MAEAKAMGSADFKAGVKDERFEDMPAPSAGAAEAKEAATRSGITAAMPPVDLKGEHDVKIILLGDSAVGKSKLIERFLMDDYNPTQLSTFALNTFRKAAVVDGKQIVVEFWDTAGQERFQKVHPAYYDGASACVLVFDVTRKPTYQHLATWFDELREGAGRIPCICVANKIDVNYEVTSKSYKFPEQHNLPFFFVSAADGTNVVKVFESAILEARRFKESEIGRAHV
jgi:Rab-like protein 2